MGLYNQNPPSPGWKILLKKITKLMINKLAN